MTKICTTIEQSQKLIELGMDKNTADMWYQYTGESFKDGITTPIYFPMVHRDDPSEKDIPAWSLSALLDFLPSKIKTSNKFGTYTYKLDLRKYDFTDDVDIYQIAYGRRTDINHSWKDMINTSESEDLLDIVFEMVCWILKNKKI